MFYGDPHPSHRWDDVSYHGSPVYHCDFCGIWNRDDIAEMPCPKAEQVLKREKEDFERNEKAEYARLKDKIERFEYLHRKYGNV